MAKTSTSLRAIRPLGLGVLVIGLLILPL